MMFDLLYMENTKTMSSETVDDMLFNELFDYIFVNDRDLFECFIKVVSSPLTDRTSIIKRQEIVKDLMTYSDFLDKISEICKAAKDVQPESRKNLYQKIDALKRLQINFRTVEVIFDYVEELGNLIKKYNFTAADLNKIKNYFSPIDKFLDLRKGLHTLTLKYLNLNFYSGEVVLSDIAKFKTLTLECLEKDVYESNNLKKNRLFSKKNKDMNGNQINYSEIKDIERQIDQITEKSIFDFCRVLTGIYSFFKSLFRSLYEQFEFYRSAIVFIQYLKNNGFMYSFPEISEDDKFLEANGLYLLPLALKNKDIKTNDVNTMNNSIFIITGYNRGGKTTFLRSIGFAQILAQSGLVVPSAYYKCSVFNFILEHFPRNEDKYLSSGLFEDEIKRLRNNFDYLKNNSLILMNEAFATTVESEGELIAADIITALAQTDSLIFFVTHFYGLAMHIDDINHKLKGKATAVNLITQKYEKPNDRTNFKIVQGDPIPNYKINLEDFI